MSEVLIDGKRYVPAPIYPRVSETTELESRTWIPAVGDSVWMNIDEGPPLGECIGYLDHPGEPRHGQPVIRKPSGDEFMIHPCFIWPFEPGSPEHLQAQADGRFSR